MSYFPDTSNWIRLVEYVSAPSLQSMSKLLKQDRTDKKFYIPAEIQQWTVIIYELRSKFSEDNQKQMISSFLNACNEVGKPGSVQGSFYFWPFTFQEYEYNSANL